LVPLSQFFECHVEIGKTFPPFSRKTHRHCRQVFFGSISLLPSLVYDFSASVIIGGAARSASALHGERSGIFPASGRAGFLCPAPASGLSSPAGGMESGTAPALIFQKFSFSLFSLGLTWGD